jgi:hypothetical protein
MLKHSILILIKHLHNNDFAFQRIWHFIQFMVPVLFILKLISQTFIQEIMTYLFYNDRVVENRNFLLRDKANVKFI